MQVNTVTPGADSTLDYRLLHEFQKNFPLCPAPFAELAVCLGVAENVLLRRLEKLRREGEIARVGAVFAPKRIGASTLVAMAVPPEKLAIVAATVNRFPEVNHNAEREHFYNLWFVVTAGSEGRLSAALGAIERAAGHPLLALPMLQQYAVGVPSAAGDDGRGVDAGGESAVPLIVAEPVRPALALDEIGRRLVMALQEGLPLFIRPFSVLASRVGCEEDEVIERIDQWCADGVIKRFGVVVRHQGTENGVEAMLVQDIPDEDVGRLGERLANEPEVALCYQRSRALPDWRYNLFCMIQGTQREEVLARIAALRQRLDLVAYAHDILFSKRRFREDAVVAV